MDCARTVLAGPYRAPVAPRSALHGITQTMAPRSMRQASSRQANTTELTSSGQRTASRMDRAGRAVSCGLPLYSAVHRIAAAFVARASLPLSAGAESKELSNFRNESDLLCYWSQEGPSSFVSSCHYPDSGVQCGFRNKLVVSSRMIHMQI